MPSPALNSNQLLEKVRQVASLEESQKHEKSFAVRMLRADIAKLKSHDAAAAYMLDGILYAQLGDISNTKANHDRALAIKPNDFPINWNYSASLSKFARYHESLLIVRHILEVGHVSVDMLTSAIWLSLVTLNVSELSWALSQATKSAHQLKDPIDESDLMKPIKALQSYVEKHPEARVGLEKVYCHVQKVLESRRKQIDVVDVVEDHFYGQHVLHITYLVEETDVDSCIEMNDDLLERIVSDESFSHWDQLVASFVPGGIDANEQGANQYASNP
ncbi:hypothetical protein SAMN04487867_104197 [Vreelandella titanicae]|uniref:hypothetical protein n=1 Tax=Vreelandella titanicae TaxID=664683 RepID=UPI000880659F|nr:hypothetical protein [Halomonas titanicae]SDI30661.1 hypothetical protein SAMN04487867_104197 [Halomonas titanicae]